MIFYYIKKKLVILLHQKKVIKKLIAYTEIERIKEYLLLLKEKGLKKKVLEKYLKKLYILELELKKVHVMELTEEIGKGR